MAFKDDIKLSIFHLDNNAIAQVDLYEEWSRKWANAVDARDRAKEQLSVKKAEVDEKIRLNPEKYGWTGEKAPTEPWIAQKIIRDKEVVDLAQEVIRCQHQVNLYVSAKETIEQRGKRLDNLIDLYKGNYFVGKSKTDHNYQENLTNKNTEAQTEQLQNNPRMKVRRKV